ncbi:MAG: formylglycine-generating enzyme family protein [Chitinispirillaceae bacterium]
MRVFLYVFIIVLAFFLILGCSEKYLSRQGNNKTYAAPEMIHIAGGTFQMGSESQDIACSGCSWGEQPVHSVTLSAFYIDKTEVTQGDYKALMGLNPSNFSDDAMKPVEMVTWFDAVLYCNARSKRDGLDTVYQFKAIFGRAGDGCRKLSGLKIDFARNGYRLPTEAEWEYACRAGTTTEYFWGRNYPSLTDADTMTFDSNAVWFHSVYVFKNTKVMSGTQPVGSKKANAWGLYDMAGNVWEWCNDYIGGYSAAAQTDPVGPDSANSRVLRGGSWCDQSDNFVFRFLRSAFRFSDFPDHHTSFRGFRCVRR